MGLLIVFKKKQKVCELSSLSLLSDQILLFGRGVTLKKTEELIPHRIVFIISLEERLYSAL